MAKGSIGTQTNTIIHLKKPKAIPCECERCRHCNKKSEITYCTYYDIFSPQRKKCVRYWCVRPAKKKKKAKPSQANRQKPKRD